MKKQINVQEEDKIEIPTKLQQEVFLYHTIIWKEFIQKSFSTNQTFITVRNEDNEIITAIPITKINSKLFGSRILATGYQEYGGMVGDKRVLSEILQYIKKKYEQDYEFLEIKGSINSKNNPLKCKELQEVPRYKRFVLELSGEENTWKKIQKSKRKAIRKAEKFCNCRKLTIKDLDQFYFLYLQNMRRFGTPPYSKGYFKNFFSMIQEKGHGKIYGSFKEGKLVAALLGFYHNKRVHITTAISNPQFANCRPSDLMHWTFIKWAIDNNYEFFDFGLVREESGQFEYKRKWGAELEELSSFYYLLKEKDIPKPLDPSNKKYQYAIKIWQKLPLKLTEVLGMRLRKILGI